MRQKQFFKIYFYCIKKIEIYGLDLIIVIIYLLGEFFIFIRN